MGRHSAPEDTDEDLDLAAAAGDGGSAVAVADEPDGRHAQHAGTRPRPTAGDDEPAPAEGLGLLDDALGAETETEPAAAPEPEPAAAPEPKPAPDPITAGAPPPARGGHGTAGDLALVREHGDVRARVIAAVIAPFIVYVAVFVVWGKLEVHSLLWIWIPAVVAGILVGFLLDAGHKRYGGSGRPGN